MRSWGVAALGWAVLVGGCTSSAPEVDKVLRADGYYLTGTAAFLKGDFAEAHKAFGEVRALNPGDPRLPAAEGEVYLAEMNVPEAVRLFEAATTLEPGRATNWSRLGYLYALKNEAARARVALEKALKLNPKDFNAHEALADLELKGGALDAGVAHLLLAAETAQGKDRPELVLKATSALTKAGLGRDVLGVLEASVTRKIESAALWTELGDARVAAGALSEAISAYEAAAALEPKDPTLWELCGELQLRLGREAEAEAAFRRSLSVQDRGVVHVALARLCQRRKDSACLAQELDQALAKASGEELRETLDLAGLLASVARKRDALSLLSAVSEEPDQRTNTDLHLSVARLARDLKDAPLVKAACARALASGGPGRRCP